MTTETLIQKVREKRGSLNSENEQILAMAMQILQDAENTSLPSAAEKSFISRNISMEEYRALPRSERRRYQSDAEALNRHWIENQFKALGANWIMVIDGQVAKHGKNLGDYPAEAEIREFQKKTGKCPFIFFSNFLLAIEESPTSWHRTKETGDFYPALSIKISGHDNFFTTEADLDTGAYECYGDLELLSGNGIITLEPDDFEYNASHLSRPYIYFAKEVLIDLVDATGTSRQCRTTMICVEDWRNSPFIAINSDRTLLLGRRLLLNLRPRLSLDFDAHLTAVEFKQASA